MYCRFCGTQNAEECNYCKQCGKLLNLNLRQNTRDSECAKQPLPLDIKTMQGERAECAEPFCPSCQANSEECHPIVKTDIKTSGGGYGFLSGCCGLVLLGPAGLLCGACGSKVTTTVKSHTWWVCKKCGKEFMTKQAAIERAILSMRSSAIYTVLLTSAFGTRLGDTDTFWIKAIVLLIVIGLWAYIPMTINEATGKPIGMLLQSREKLAFWGKFAAYGILSALIGLVWGVSTTL